MKKVVVVLFLCILSFACGPVPDDVEATSSLGNPDPMSRACITGFTRIYPNFCSNDNPSDPNPFVDATGCNTRTFLNAAANIPVNSKVVLQIYWTALSNNVIGLRSNLINFYSTNTCLGTSITAISKFSTREEAAVVAGTTLAEAYHYVQYVTIVGAVGTFYTVQLNAGGNGNADIVNLYVIGYYD